MSMNPDTSMSVSDSYSEFEVQQVGLRQQPGQSGTGDNGNNVEREDVYTTTPVDQNGIDNDELAELVAFYRTVRLFIQDEDAETQSEAGDADGEGGMGINIGGSDDFAVQVPANRTTEARGTPGPPSEDGGFIAGEADDPGQIDYWQVGAEAGFQDDVNGPGGGGATGVSDRYVNLRTQFGSGPYVDRTDDIDFLVETVNNDVVGRTFHEVIYTLYWDVTTVEGGRAAFAPPR